MSEHQVHQELIFQSDAKSSKTLDVGGVVYTGQSLLQGTSKNPASPLPAGVKSLPVMDLAGQSQHLRVATLGKLWTAGRQWKAVPCTNWELRALTGAAEGLSRASLVCQRCYFTNGTNLHRGNRPGCAALLHSLLSLSLSKPIPCDG